MSLEENDLAGFLGGKVFREVRPQVVAHAAAHKHVPLMETNATEAVKNNVLGSLTLGEVAGECGAEAFILISTDKAVRPSSVMGATKRVAELVVQGLEERYATRYVAVRFGNVLGSAGSDAKRMIELSGHRRSGEIGAFRGALFAAGAGGVGLTRDSDLPCPPAGLPFEP